MYALGGRLYVATTEVEMLCIEDGVVMRNFSCLPTKKRLPKEAASELISNFFM